MIPLANLPWKFIGGGVAALTLVGAGCAHLSNDRKVREERDTLRVDLAETEIQLDTEVENHRQTKENYEAAQVIAARMQKERIARVKREQERITANVVSNYKARLDAVTDRADRLRTQAANRASADGAAIRLRLPEASGTATGVDGATGDYQLSIDEREIATKQAIQLDELITWVQEQFRVDPNATE